jgi:hypothetical protein
VGTAADVDAGKIEHPVSSGFGLGRFWCRRLQLLSALSQAGLLGAIGEEAVVTDSHESGRQNVQQETANELFRGKGSCLPPISVGAISVAELHLPVIAGQQAVIGDGDAMRVTSQIVQELLGAREGWLRVDDPWLFPQAAEPTTSTLQRA